MGTWGQPLSVSSLKLLGTSKKPTPSISTCKLVPLPLSHSRDPSDIGSDSLGKHTPATTTAATVLETQQGQDRRLEDKNPLVPLSLPPPVCFCSAVSLVAHLFTQQTLTEHLLCARLRRAKGKQIRTCVF